MRQKAQQCFYGTHFFLHSPTQPTCFFASGYLYQYVGGASKGSFSGNYRGAISSVVERLVYTEDVGGSSPSSPTRSISYFKLAIQEAPQMVSLLLWTPGSLTLKE